MNKKKSESPRNAKQHAKRLTESPVGIKGSARRLTETQLERVADGEISGGTIIVFPEEYRQFMLRHNGGDPDPAFFVYRRHGAPHRSWVEVFCPITSSQGDPLNLWGANQLLAKLAIHSGVPYDCIAIGSAPGHQHLLLFVGGRRRGQVWLKCWDDVNIEMDPARDTNPNEGLYKLAPSFDKFLAMLCTEEEAERRVTKAEQQAKKRR